jgi:hypothetical protein
MYKFICAAMTVLVTVSGVFARVGIQAEVGTLNMSDLAMAMTDNNPDVLSTKVGLRFSGSGPTAFDILLGFVSRSEVPPVAYYGGYSGSPKIFSFGVTLGPSVKVHNGEKTSLSFIPRYTISFFQNGDIYQDLSSNTHFDYTTLISSTIYFGLEPCFKFSENMELFTNFGFTIKINPNSKVINQAGPGGPRTWQEMNDGITGFGFSGILLGFRYNL